MCIHAVHPVPTKHGDEGDNGARQQQVGGVEERLAAHADEEPDIRVRRREALVLHHVGLGAVSECRFLHCYNVIGYSFSCETLMVW